jgi:microcystin-dependent protein
MAAGTVSSVGSSQPHDNRSPYLTLNYIIALQGIFPSRG